jgi:small subunit ribosomal protein S16
MSVVIRLRRSGAKKRPFYRMVAADSRRQRDGRFLEILGHYNPVREPMELVIHKDRVERWLANGAVPSDQAASLLRSAGISLQIAATRSKKQKAAAGEKKTVKRAVKRTVSERKTRQRVSRKAAKVKAAAKPAEKPAETAPATA